jgi:uncharacterized membrane protein YidH (DUF202 family)
MTPADDIEDTNPKSARERTELAWTRTAVAFAALGAAVLKDHLSAGLPILALSALVWRLGSLARGPAAGTAQDRRLLLLTILVTGVSLVALIISLLSPSRA